MKILFLVYHTLVEHSGISKKILAEVEALEKCGVDVSLCFLRINPDGSKERVCDGEVLRSFGKGLGAKIRKRTSYGDIIRYVKTRGIDTVYIRYDINADPYTCRMMRRLHKSGVRTVVEIPTWPYDGEFKGQSLKLRLQLKTDRKYRVRFFKYCDFIVNCSNDEQILGHPTINAGNGVDFENIPVAAENTEKYEMRMLSVANIHLWHGLDRLILGMARRKDIPAVLHIVGDGLPEIIDGYKELARQYGLLDRVKILGPEYGSELDKEFKWCNIAVGSLARHRSGIETIKTIKNREYAARGRAFFYSENDPDFDERPYVFKVQQNDDPVDMQSIYEFFRKARFSPEEIRESVKELSWECRMRKVIEGIS